MSDVLLFVLVAGGMILAHEFGHFLMAKARGIRVEEFGIGFPPRLLTMFEAGGTRYTLNAIPLGGFVRPAGEDNPDIPGGLASASKTTRALVLLAGPATNILLGFLAFTLAFRFTAPDTSRVLVSDVDPQSPGEAAGILPGDIIVQVDGVPIDGVSTLQSVVAENAGVQTEVVVERRGETHTVELVPRLNPPEGQGPIGILLGSPIKTVSWGEALLLGADATAYQVSLTVRLPVLLLQGEVQPEQARVSGLKGIYDMLAWANDVDQASQRPFFTLQLIGVIGIGLAIANLLPIPALDGGRLTFLAIEAITRRRVAARIEGMAHTVGFAVLLALLVYITIQDFLNPIALPR